MMWNYLNHATLDSFRQMPKFNCLFAFYNPKLEISY